MLKEKNIEGIEDGDLKRALVRVKSWEQGRVDVYKSHFHKRTIAQIFKMDRKEFLMGAVPNCGYAAVA